MKLYRNKKKGREGPGLEPLEGSREGEEKEGVVQRGEWKQNGNMGKEESSYVGCYL